MLSQKKGCANEPQMTTLRHDTETDDTETDDTETDDTEQGSYFPKSTEMMTSS